VVNVCKILGIKMAYDGLPAILRNNNGTVPSKFRRKGGLA
jgi:hypothetical protein